MPLTEIICVRIPVAILEAIDQLVAEGFFESRSAFIREAIRKYLYEFLRQRARYIQYTEQQEEPARA